MQVQKLINLVFINNSRLNGTYLTPEDMGDLLCKRYKIYKALKYVTTKFTSKTYVIRLIYVVLNMLMTASAYGEIMGIIYQEIVIQSNHWHLISVVLYIIRFSKKNIMGICVFICILEMVVMSTNFIQYFHMHPKLFQHAIWMTLHGDLQQL